MSIKDLLTYLLILLTQSKKTIAQHKRKLCSLENVFVVFSLLTLIFSSDVLN